MVTLLQPRPCLSLCVTGHRGTNQGFRANMHAVEATLAGLFGAIGGLVDAEAATLGAVAPVRLLSLLADGTDQMAMTIAQQRGWTLAAPLPFGRALNSAINARPATHADAEALLQGVQPDDPACAADAATLAGWYEAVELFELADRDTAIAGEYLAVVGAPANESRTHAFRASASAQVALAGRVMIEQADLMIAVWDGESTDLVGGTGHTVACALDQGCAVLRIDPAAPERWHILHAPEALAASFRPGTFIEDRDATLARIVRSALRPGEGGALHQGAAGLAREKWYARSSPLWHGYRRIEALFGGEKRPFRSLINRYETPDAIATGSGAPLLAAARALPGCDPAIPERIEREVLGRFAWTDGISARLSDAYRGGMTVSFVLSALAIVIGIAYEPFADVNRKWMFACAELGLLLGIVAITWLGSRRRWHKRWFETRRVAEYLRHAPIMLLLGAARPPGRWPKGTGTSWPEYYALHLLRAQGLPRVAMTQSYLRGVLETLLAPHVSGQRDYHVAKSKRLHTVHHRLDKLSERLFLLAVLSVSTYLVLALVSGLGYMPHEELHGAAKIFSFLGVMFPTFGAALAGIRYFGDFERFAGISEVTAGRLEAVDARIRLLQSAPDHLLTYAQVTELAHAADDIVVSEIESWQAVFGGKHFTVPV
ncbi:MAG: hypothetical protein NVSMB69_00820 [Novosphingobium sp.]